MLHPAHKQLFFGRGAGKTADIRAFVGLAGEAHAQDGRQVVAKRAPAGEVVTHPVLRVLLNAGAAASADYIRSCTGIFADRLAGEPAHNSAHDGLERADGAAFAIVIDKRLMIQQTVVFTVVVPNRIGADRDDSFCQIFLPGRSRLGLRVIPEGTGAAPPGVNRRLLRVLRIPDKDTSGLKFIKQRMGSQHAGLDVGHVLRAALVHGRKKALRIREAVVIPHEDAAQIPLRSVAAREVETVDGEALCPDVVDELQQCLIAVVLELGIIHGRALIAQCPLGQQGRTSCQHRVVIYNLSDGGTGHQEQVDRAAVRLPVAVARPVIALLTAEIEDGLVVVIIEETDGMAGAAAQPDVERDVFVECVALFRIVAPGVCGALADEFLVLVERPVLLAEAVEAVILLHAAVVDDAVVRIAQERVAGQCAVELFAVLIVKTQTERGAVNHQCQRVGLQNDLFFRLAHDSLLRRDTLPIALEQRIEPVRPGGGHQHIGGVVHFVSGEGDAQADDPVRHEEDAQIRVVQMRSITALKGLDRNEFSADIHQVIPPLYIISS